MPAAQIASREEEPVISGARQTPSTRRDRDRGMACRVIHISRKRRLRFSLRGLLAVTACFSAILAACRWSYDKAVERHEHDLYWSNRIGKGSCLHWEQSLWGVITGRDLARVQRASFGTFLSWPRDQLDHSSLKCLAHFSELRALRLFLVDVDDEAGRYIAQCKSLRKLDVAYTNVTDKFVQHISSLPLERLYLSKTKVTARSLATLERMPRLRSVRLNQLGISEEALASLAVMRPDLQFDSDPALMWSDWDWPIKSD